MCVVHRQPLGVRSSLEFDRNVRLGLATQAIQDAVVTLALKTLHRFPEDLKITGERKNHRQTSVVNVDQFQCIRICPFDAAVVAHLMRYLSRR